MTGQLERELLKEFAAAGVFSQMTRFDPKPDVVIVGRIDAFHEAYRPRTWTHVPILALSDAVKEIQDQIVRDAQLRRLASRP